MTAKTKGVFWEHLMRIKGKLECLIKLANIKKVELEPRTSLHCLVCSFKLEAQQLMNEYPDLLKEGAPAVTVGLVQFFYLARKSKARYRP